MLIFQSSYFYPLTPVYMPTRASMPTSVITSTFPNSASTVTQLVVFHYFFLLSPSNNVLECFPVTLNFFFSRSLVNSFCIHTGQRSRCHFHIHIPSILYSLYSHYLFFSSFSSFLESLSFSPPPSSSSLLCAFVFSTCGNRQFP